MSNKRDGGPGLPVAAGGDGISCIAEQRAVERIRDGESRTGFLEFGNRIAIEMLDRDGRSIFGRYDQTVIRYRRDDDE